MMQVDLLHPLASLQWSECSELPVGMQDAQAICLDNKLYVGGGCTSGSSKEHARLYIYSPLTDEWSINGTPVLHFALVTYQSQLVLVGGKMLAGGLATNKLWSLHDQGQWRETLPPMIESRSSATAVEYMSNILVAGGMYPAGNMYLDIVEIYNDLYWAKAQSIPIPCRWMKSAVINEHWYLMGGVGQEKKVFYASLVSLVASSKRHSDIHLCVPSVWKRLPDVPYAYSSPTVFRNMLIAVGGFPPTSSIHAYLPSGQSWIQVGHMPVGRSSICISVFHKEKLLVIGGVRSTLECCTYVHQAILKGNVMA